MKSGTIEPLQLDKISVETVPIADSGEYSFTGDKCYIAKNWINAEDIVWKMKLKIRHWILIITYKMGIFNLKKNTNEIEMTLISIINRGFELSKPSEYLKQFVEKLSPTSIRVGNDTVELSDGNLYVMGWGKVSGAMAYTLEKILGPEIIEGGIVVTSNPCYSTKKIKILEGTHPLPSEQNIYATKEILTLAERCTENDYVICLVSGGGSALLCLPAEGITLEDKIASTNTLLQEGIEVEQINRIRKHLSGIKGGKLAKAIYPGRITNLIVSDDITDTIHSIGSGPTVPDPIKFIGALEIINRYSLRR